MLLFSVLIAIWFIVIGKTGKGNKIGRFWLVRLFLSFILSLLSYTLCFSFIVSSLIHMSAITETKVEEIEMAEMKEGIYLARNISKDGYFFITNNNERIKVLGKNKIIIYTFGLSKPKAEIIRSKFKGWWVNMVFLFEPCFEEHRIFLLKATQIENPDLEYW